MLKEGETASSAMRCVVSRRNGYRTGHVTIDNSDWIVDQRLTKRLTEQPAADIAPYRSFYLEHMWDRAQYYDDLAKKNRRPLLSTTLLMHFNLLMRSSSTI